MSRKSLAVVGSHSVSICSEFREDHFGDNESGGTLLNKRLYDANERQILGILGQTKPDRRIDKQMYQQTPRGNGNSLFLLNPYLVRFQSKLGILPLTAFVSLIQPS